MCPSTIIGMKKGLRFHYKLVFDTFIVKYAACTIMASQYKRNLQKINFASMLKSLTTLRNSWSRMVPAVTLRHWQDRWCTEKLSSEDSTKFRNSDSNLVWICSSDAERWMVKRLAKDKDMAVLFRTGRTLVVSSALMAFSRLSEHKVQIVNVEIKEQFK